MSNPLFLRIYHHDGRKTECSMRNIVHALKHQKLIENHPEYYSRCDILQEEEH